MSRIFEILKPRANRFIEPWQSRSPRDPKDWRFKIKKWAFNLTGFNKYGLYSDDLLYHDHVVMREAVRRLPKDVLDARNFRLTRAIQLDFLKIYLPKEKWISYQQDLEYRYLRPYIEEIVMERMEIYEFGCTNYSDHDWPAGELK